VARAVNATSPPANGSKSTAVTVESKLADDALIT
jgi:hypothetical protein